MRSEKRETRNEKRETRNEKRETRMKGGESRNKKKRETRIENRESRTENREPRNKDKRESAQLWILDACEHRSLCYVFESTKVSHESQLWQTMRNSQTIIACLLPKNFSLPSNIDTFLSFAIQYLTENNLIKG